MSAQAALEEVLLLHNGEASSTQHDVTSHNNDTDTVNTAAHRQPYSIYDTAGILIAITALCLSHHIKLW